MHRIETALHALSRSIVYVATVAALLLTGLVVLSAVMRYLVASPFHFTEELVGLLFMTMVFFTLPYGISERRHIRVTIFTRLLPPRGKRVAEAFNSVIVIIFGSLFFVQSWKFTAFTHEIGARSEQSEIVLAPWMATIPATIGLLVLVALVQLVRDILTWRNER